MTYEIRAVIPFEDGGTESYPVPYDGPFAYYGVYERNGPEISVIADFYGSAGLTHAQIFVQAKLLADQNLPAALKP